MSKYTVISYYTDEYKPNAEALKQTVEDVGLDISEHAESAYSDEEEFLLDMDDYKDELQEKDEILFKKKWDANKKWH